jgi:hypothetical protein
MSTHKPAIFFINTDFSKNTPLKLKAQSLKLKELGNYDRFSLKKSTLMVLKIKY